MLGENRLGFAKVINGFPIREVKINEVLKRTIRSIQNSTATGGDLDLLLLLLDWAELLSDGRAVLALVAVEDLLHLQDALAPELVLPTLFTLLGAGTHQLCGSV